ncbi:MAG: DUF2225 domain-containing protein [Christensenellaceae bacterium]
MDTKMENTLAPQAFAKGSVLLHEGDITVSEMYILLRGNVEIYKDFGKAEQALVSTLGAGEFFGEVSFLLGKRRLVTVAAKTDIVVMRLNNQNILNFIRQQPEAVLALLRSLSRRVNESEAYEKEQEAVMPAPNAGESAAAAAGAEGVGPLGDGALFLKEHGIYNLPEGTQNEELLLPRSFECPMCKTAFKTATVRMSKIVTEKTDPDMRVHYKGVEPMYYDVITCPECCFSALSDMFGEGLKSRREVVMEKISGYDLPKPFSYPVPRDANSVFTSYYLALLCVPAFQNTDLLRARLWMKLSWLYHDCGDEKVEKIATANALKAYYYAYENMDPAAPPRLQQSLYYMLGELNYKMGDIKKARDFLFKAKIEKDGAKVIKKYAEDLLDEIKESGLAE